MKLFKKLTINLYVNAGLISNSGVDYVINGLKLFFYMNLYNIYNKKLLMVSINFRR